MANQLTLGYSHLTGNIYAGRSKEVKNKSNSLYVRQFTGEKHDVTQQAIQCVAEKLNYEQKEATFQLNSGKTLVLKVEVID